MKRLPLLLLGVLLLGKATAQDAKKDLKEFQGTWESIKVVFNGKDLSDDNKIKFKLIFKGAEAKVVSSDAVEKEYAKLVFKLDPSTTPKIMDVTVSGGVQKDTVMEGIYELKGDELKICAKVFGKDRPSEFTSEDGSGIVLAVLRKEKQ